MTQDSRPGTWQLFRIWANIGLQSFGGGSSTTFLIQHAFIDKYKWMTMEDFAQMWSLCVFTPGINLVAITVLIGRRLGGAWGVVVSLLGMLVPSATITCLLAALFLQVEQVAAVQAILRGVIPATGGIMLLVGLNFSLPLIRKGYAIGIPYLLASGMLVLVCSLAIIFLKVPVIAVVLGAVLLGALFFAPKSAPALTTGEQGHEHD